jgi:hypothetical protein
VKPRRTKPVRKMVGVAEVEGRPFFQRSSTTQTKSPSGTASTSKGVSTARGRGCLARVKVRQNGQHRQQIACQVTARVAQKSRGPGKVEGQKSQQRARARKAMVATRYCPCPAAITPNQPAPMAPNRRKARSCYP